jgi:predicted Rossmann fold nucleotide-binding protein DprA/Smf involved in DNA uptake
MSKAVLVTQASEKSGSLITANLSADFGRDVFVVPPHDITNPEYRGNVKLLRDGATPVYGAYELLAEFLDLSDLEIPERRHIAEKKIAVTLATEITPQVLADLSALTEDEKGIFEIIKNNNAAFDIEDIAEASQMDTMDILDIITELEIGGYILKNSESKYTTI